MPASRSIGTTRWSRPARRSSGRASWRRRGDSSNSSARCGPIVRRGWISTSCRPTRPRSLGRSRRRPAGCIGFCCCTRRWRCRCGGRGWIATASPRCSRSWPAGRSSRTRSTCICSTGSRRSLRSGRSGGGSPATAAASRACRPTRTIRSACTGCSRLRSWPGCCRSPRRSSCAVWAAGSRRSGSPACRGCGWSSSAPAGRTPIGTPGCRSKPSPRRRGQRNKRSPTPLRRCGLAVRFRGTRCRRRSTATRSTRPSSPTRSPAAANCCSIWPIRNTGRGRSCGSRSTSHGCRGTPRRPRPQRWPAQCGFAIRGRSAAGGSWPGWSIVTSAAPSSTTASADPSATARATATAAEPGLRTPAPAAT